MATSNKNQNSITDEYIRDLLECPVCMETIKSVPVYQCNNGHVICKDCIKKLNNCPICRNDSTPARNLQLEKLVQRLEGIQCEKRGPSLATPNLQKWGKGSVRSYGTIVGTNQETRIDINLQANPEQATPRQATPRQETLRQATPRLGINLPASDVEAVPRSMGSARTINGSNQMNSPSQSMPRQATLRPTLPRQATLRQTTPCDDCKALLWATLASVIICCVIRGFIFLLLHN